MFKTLGQEVMTLVDRVSAAGRYQATFAVSDLPSGLYLYRFDVASFK